ncbi:hypothetical protein QYF61_025898 [Mycteria americana]|uniref:Uncharacterized protein n=1 Tax=Mycteria americana TaxID=33587 RepID=A0AAN7S3C7_MYCAM|nr:hypothetical protein QYF61_025898 [Mycteria americana]
MREPHTVGQAG